MFWILLKILSILGWILLAVLILLLIALLLVLFYPISYRLEWKRSKTEMFFKAKAHWLLGLLQMRYTYPEPGSIVVKLLGLTVYDLKKQKTKLSRRRPEKNTKTVSEENKEISSKDDSTPIKEKGPEKETFSESYPEEEKLGILERIRKILENIIDKIRKFRDKVMHIKESVQYYQELLKEEDSRILFSNVFLRSGKIIKSIRPRKVKGQIILGTGSPDTTGYAMALYGILSPYLGQNLVLTSNFEEKVLEGKLFAKGRVTIGILLIHGLNVGLDRRFRSFIKKLKREVK